MGGAICGGHHAEARTVRVCPSEGRRRRFYCTFAHWYGWTFTCLGCGDQWQDGERAERPFMRGWRAERIKKAEAGWKRAGTIAEAVTTIRAQLAEMFPPDTATEPAP